MNDVQKKTIEKWREYLKLYLNATQVMAEIPDLFDLNSAARTDVMAKQDMPHEAVSVMINHLEKMPGEAYNQFLKAIKNQHEWLHALIIGNETKKEQALNNYEYHQYVSKFLTVFMENITNGINASEISMELKLGEFISEEQNERIDAASKNRGNIEGVKMLLQILVRSNTKWLKNFKQILEKKNYSTELKQIFHDLPDELKDFKCSIEPEDMSMETKAALLKEEASDEDDNFFSSLIQMDELHGKNVSNFAIAPARMREAQCWRVSSTYPRNQTFQKSFGLSGRNQRVNNTLVSSPTNDIIPKKAGFNFSSLRRQRNQPVNASPVNSPANSIIPKEAGFNPSLLRKQRNRSVSSSSVKNSPANSIIPKEAGINVSLMRNQKEVTGKDALQPEQIGLSSKPINGQNVIIYGSEVADSTKMAVHIIQSRFPSILDSNGLKVAFIVPKIKKDHYLIERYFASTEWAVSFHDGRTDKLNYLLEKSQVIMITPQVLLTALVEASDTYDITQFDMIIIEECQNVYKTGPLKHIMLEYLKAKQRTNSMHLPQVLGLCANLGYGNIQKQETAEKYTWALCALLNAVGGITTGRATPKLTSRRSKSQLEKQDSFIEKQHITDPFNLCICETIDEMLNLLTIPSIMKYGVPKSGSLSKGSVEYIQWCNSLFEKAKQINDVTLSSILKLGSSYLRIYNQALSISLLCRADDALDFLIENVKKHPHYNVANKVVVKRLFDISDKQIAKLRSYVQDGSCQNDTLIEIKKQISTCIQRNKNAKLLLVVNEGDVMPYLKNWLNEERGLAHFSLNAKFLEDSEPPSTVCQRQKNVCLNDFKYNRIKALICMKDIVPNISVACDLIIYYNCNAPGKSSKQKINASAKSPCIVSVMPKTVPIDHKAKVDKRLVMERAAETIERLRQQNENRYIQILTDKQSELLQCDGRIAITESRDTRGETKVMSP